MAARIEFNPLVCSRTSMAPNGLLMAKLSLIFLVATGFVSEIGKPLAPHAQELDALRVLPGYEATLLTLFGVAGASLLLNFGVRVASTLLGVIVLLVHAQSLPVYRADSVLCGFILVLCGLQPARESPTLVRWQVLVTLLAVVVSRPFDQGWVESVVLEGWIHDRLTHPVYTLLSRLFSSEVVGSILSWATIAGAVLIGLGLFLSGFRRAAVGLAVAFHAAIYFVIGTKDVGAFSIVLGIAYLSFLNWPTGQIEALWPRACGWPMWLRIALDRFDWDSRVVWPFPENPDGDLEVRWGDNHTWHWRALCGLLSYFPAFHFAVFGVLILAQVALPAPFSVFAHIAVVGTLLLFFGVPPVRKRVRRVRSAASTKRAEAKNVRVES